MKQVKKTGTHTSDRVDVGTHVVRRKTNGTSGSGAVRHAGQPKSMSGSGLKTGHTSTNC